jgi:hypothetical protein
MYIRGCSPVIGFTGRGKAGNVTSEPLEVRVDGTVVSARKCISVSILIYDPKLTL